MTHERTHLDLFSGIGGFALAARANGVRTVQFCEIDPRCRAFLAKAWPGVPIWDDVRTLRMANPEQNGWAANCNGQDAGTTQRTAEEHATRGLAVSIANSPTCGVYLLTAGVPCQPASRAGKQRGKDDVRWLWPEALRVVAEVRPTWALLENPPGIGDVGLRGILAQLEAQGYEVRVLSIGACAVGAPHRRMRYWIICRRVGMAHSKQERRQGQGSPASAVCSAQNGDGQTDRPVNDNATHPLAHATQRGQREHGGAQGQPGHADQCDQGGMGDTQEGRGRAGLCDCQPGGERRDFATNPNCWANYVWLPCADGKVRRAPDDSFGLVDGLHRSVLGALGNSIVPQVAAQIIHAMIEADE